MTDNPLATNVIRPVGVGDLLVMEANGKRYTRISDGSALDRPFIEIGVDPLGWDISEQPATGSTYEREGIADIIGAPPVPEEVRRSVYLPRHDFVGDRVYSRDTASAFRKTVAAMRSRRQANVPVGRHRASLTSVVVVFLCDGESHQIRANRQHPSLAPIVPRFTVPEFDEVDF